MGLALKLKRVWLPLVGATSVALVVGGMADRSFASERTPVDSSRAASDTVHSPPQPKARGMTTGEMRAAKPMPLPAANGPPVSPPNGSEIRPTAPPGSIPGSQGTGAK